jgi:hypothetical protein
MELIQNINEYLVSMRKAQPALMDTAEPLKGWDTMAEI